MADPIFVRTRHNYGSYVDFFRLVELSGYHTIYVDEMLQHDSRDTTFIVTPVNGEWNERPKGYTQGCVILYQLEWNWDGEHNVPPSVDAVWNGDKWHAEKNNFRYVPLGSHPSLNEYPNMPKVSTYACYDASFMGYRDPARRARLLHEMVSIGVKFAPDGWGQARSAALLDSRCMVAIHQLDNMPAVAPLRMCIAAAHKLAVISEMVADKGIFAKVLPDCKYDDLPEIVKGTVRNPQNKLAELGNELYQLLCVDHTFRKSIEAAL